MLASMPWLQQTYLSTLVKLFITVFPITMIIRSYGGSGDSKLSLGQHHHHHHSISLQHDHQVEPDSSKLSLAKAPAARSLVQVDPEEPQTRPEERERGGGRTLQFATFPPFCHKLVIASKVGDCYKTNPTQGDVGEPF